MRNPALQIASKTRQCYSAKLAYCQTIRQMVSMDLKIKPVTVTAQTADRLRQAIVSGHFQPNQRLIEADLCKSLGVSRSSLREALRHLEAEKLISSTPNRGPSVRTINWKEAQEIYHVRAILEGEAAALFTPIATSEHIEQMQTALDAFALADQSNDEAGRLASTSMFYSIILSNCGNSIIFDTLEGLRARINFLRARSMSNPKRGKSSLQEMQAILDAIKQRNPKQARKTANAHVKSACRAARLHVHP